MKTYNCSKFYTSLEELVKEKNIDGVAVFTEVKHVLECLHHDKHVLCTVTACWTTLDEAERLYETVKKSGLNYIMSETSYYQ
jgi:predicted dehydrogenase